MRHMTERSGSGNGPYRNPDLVLLDLMLPRMDGFTVCRKIREVSNVPVVMLTAKEEEVDKVLGLELGADDYITKPFSQRELMARLKANLRRVNGWDNPIEKQVFQVRRPDHRVDRYEVKRDGKVIELTLRSLNL